MSTVQDILTRVRDTLADPSGSRWSDDRLIRLIDEAQKNICRRAKVLRYSKNIVVNPDQSTYTLPSNNQTLSRVLYNNEPLEVISHEQMDFKNGSTWETNTGTPKYAITNKMERGLVKLSPIPDFVENDPFDYAEANILGIYYIKIPDTLDSVDDELEIEELYNTLVKHYVVGYALRDDMDTQNRAFGNEELGLYEAELVQVTKEVAKDFVSNNTVYETSYRGGI